MDSNQENIQPVNECSVLPSLMIPHIPDDIMANILLRLPKNALIRFRSVSKNWLHLCCCCCVRTSTLGGFFVDDLDFSIQFLPLDPLSIDPQAKDQIFNLDWKGFSFLPRNLDEEFRIIASSNGFVLYTRTIDSQTTYVINNPFTTQTVVLPFTVEPAIRNEKPSVCFDCDVDHARHLAHYTVMLLSEYEWGYIIKMITSKDSRKMWMWNKIELDFPQRLHNPKVLGLINGIFYLMFETYMYLIKPAIAFTTNFNHCSSERAVLPFLNLEDEHCCCIFENRIYFAVLKRDDGILQLWVSRAITEDSEQDFGWQRLYNIRTFITFTSEQEISKFICFHPQDPKMIFFANYPVIKSYNFQTEQVRLYDPYSTLVKGPSDFVPFEWFPCPSCLHD